MSDINSDKLERRTLERKALSALVEIVDDSTDPMRFNAAMALLQYFERNDDE